MNVKLLLSAVLVALVLSVAGLVVSDDRVSDDSDADVNFTYGTVNALTGVSYSFDCTAYYPAGNWNTVGSWSIQSGGVPGLLLIQDSNNIGAHYTGTPTTGGDYTVVFKKSFSGSSNNPVMTVIYHVENNNVTVTYSAGIGTVYGSSSWSETITKNTFASLPSASYSSGAYIFKGWSTSSGSSSVLSSYTATSNVTLYAVWEQQTVQVSSWSATISHGQTGTHAFSTTPSSANLSISSSGISGASVSGKTLSFTIPENMAPGKYYIVLSSSASGWITGNTTVTVTVPVQIVPPIEYTIVQGATWSYEPVTNPSNSAISLVSVKLGGTTISNHGLSVSGRTITGVLSQLGTYDITFTASASGYTSTTKTVRVFVYEAPPASDPVAIGSVSGVVRADEPRTWDFVALGLQNVVNIEWLFNGSVFASSSNTAVYEFATAGAYTITAKVYGADGSFQVASKNVVVLDAYHPELAWVGQVYTNIVPDGPLDSSNASWLNNSQGSVTVGGVLYSIISGTPTTAGAFSYIVGATTYNVTVYPAETVAPFSDFDYELSSDKKTVTVTFTGTNASVVYYNYDDGSAVGTSTSHTYTVTEGYFTIVANAVNNISERQSSHLVAIGGIDDEVSTVSVEDLTDITVRQGETVIIKLTLASGDTVSISGSASAFLEVSGDRILGDTSEVDPGEYSLTVVVLHNNGSTTTNTIKITVLPKEVESEDIDYEKLFIGLIIIFVLILILAFAVSRKRKGKKLKSYKGGKR